MERRPVIVLDTHAVIWFAEDNPRLGPRATAMVDAALRADELGIAAISFWEITMLLAKGRLVLAEPPMALRRAVLESGIRELPLDGDSAIRAAELSAFHGDPADRLIVATALQHDATLITADRAILQWRGKLRTRDARR